MFCIKATTVPGDFALLEDCESGSDTGIGAPLWAPHPPGGAVIL